ncbi:MAG: sulfite exporter TauE/SafE family protein [Bacteroidetes bacterium]|nr:sulfite exporter TauE/SafE family protein [Bacteroidota bacterium]
MEYADIAILIIPLIAAFVAGFVDSIAGGGGLIQLPALFFTFPQMPLQTTIGTNKFPNFLGTIIAAIQYNKLTTIYKKNLLAALLLCFTGALLGTYFLQKANAAIFKPVLFVVLIIIAITIYFKKEFGLKKISVTPLMQKIYLPLTFAVGFYDGLIGPGTGIFLILICVYCCGHDLLQASATAKTLNLSSNFASILLFVFHNQITWKIAIPMTACNIAGAYWGSKMSVLRGNKFIRQILFLVIVLVIARFGYDVFKSYF